MRELGSFMAGMGPGLPRREALRTLVAGSLAGVAGACGDASASQEPAGMFDVRQFGARGDGAAIDVEPIQAAIEAAAQAGAGVVWLPPGRYALGEERLVLRSGVSLRGAGVDWAQEPTGGVQLLYAGTGEAILGQNIKNASIQDVLIDFSATGETGGGIHLNGAWLCTLRNLRILSAGRHGHNPGVLIDTNNGTWGAQHLYIERVEVPSSTVRLVGNGPHDQVTTTVVNVVRGLRYEIDWASSITLVDTTAEAFADIGIQVRHSTQTTLIGVDIEGSGEIGLSIGPEVQSLVALGLNFAGFTGGTRVRGRPVSGILAASYEPITFWGPVRWVDETDRPA